MSERHIQITYVIGLLAEIALISFAICKIWQLIGIVFEWCCAHITAGMLPIIIVSIILGGVALTFYNTAYGIKSDEQANEEVYEDE